VANGHEPDCVTCVHFDTVPKGTAQHPVNVEDPATDCICRFHRVHLPLSREKALLICRNWESKRGLGRLIDWPTQSRYEPGVLYAYKSMYEPQLRIVARIAELPPA